MRSAVSLADSRTIGRPVPGWVLAPAKYRFCNAVAVVRAQIANLSKVVAQAESRALGQVELLEIFRRPHGLFQHDAFPQVLDPDAFQPLDDEAAGAHARPPNPAAGLPLMCPTGTSTISASPSSGAKDGSVRAGALT